MILLSPLPPHHYLCLTTACVYSVILWSSSVMVTMFPCFLFLCLLPFPPLLRLLSMRPSAAKTKSPKDPAAFQPPPRPPAPKPGSLLTSSIFPPPPKTVIHKIPQQQSHLNFKATMPAAAAAPAPAARPSPPPRPALSQPSPDVSSQRPSLSMASPFFASSATSPAVRGSIARIPSFSSSTAKKPLAFLGPPSSSRSSLSPAPSSLSQSSVAGSVVGREKSALLQKAPPPRLLPAFQQPKTLEEALGKFGHKEFRRPQREVIEAFLAGSDCYVLLPTGAGKSLCYQVPAIMSTGITLVVSPLLALIGNQVGFLRSRGIEAHSLNSSISEAERKDIIRDLESEAPRCRLLYVTPELMAQPHFSRRLITLQK